MWHGHGFHNAPMGVTEEENDRTMLATCASTLAAPLVPLAPPLLPPPLGAPTDADGPPVSMTLAARATSAMAPATVSPTVTGAAALANSGGVGPFAGGGLGGAIGCRKAVDSTVWSGSRLTTTTNRTTTACRFQGNGSV